MSTLDADHLYALLPSVYRIRDAQQGQPLRALVALIAQEFEALEEDVSQLYDDQFIETCADWAAPYIGDLIGWRQLHGVVPKVASPRAEIANTIGYRRRKGTAAMLEQLARDVSGWPARAVEFFEQLATTQYMNHTRLHAQATAAVRSLPRMLSAGGPFNTLAHTAEMRHPEGGSGRYDIPNIGLFLWRLAPLSVSQLPLTPHTGDASGTKFRLNPLGADQPLFRDPVPEDRIDHIAEPADVPAPLRIREFALQLRLAQATTEQRDAAGDYGVDASVVLQRAGAAVPINRFAGVNTPAIPELRIADLRDVFDGGGTWTGWAHQDDIGTREIYLDPERGRVLLGSERAAEHADDPFIATWHRGFSREMGGGEYERVPPGDTLPTDNAADGANFQALLDAAAPGGRVLADDSLVYAFTPSFTVDAPAADGIGREVVVAAVNGARPVIAASGDIVLDIGAQGRLVLDGLVISGGALRLAASADNAARELVLRHCMLVPGLTLEPGGTPSSPGAPSLRIEHPFAKLVLEDCIVGSVQMHEDAELSASGCIVDACSATAPAVEGLTADDPGPALTLRECTVIGKVRTQVMTLASNTVFDAALASGDAWPAPVWAERRQEGCVRFSFVPTDSLVPRRHRCVPSSEHPHALPHFTSRRSADPGYGQLRTATDRAIREGADDGGEMGAMHALYAPQRAANVRLRLDEYLRHGLRAGIFFAT